MSLSKTRLREVIAKMISTMPLNRIPRGCIAIVDELDCRASLYERFKELGIIRGTVIQRVMTSPLGDPDAYLVRGTMIALRREDAAGISVRMADGDGNE